MSGIIRNNLFPSTFGMTDDQVAARQAASRIATVRPRPLDPADPWDSTRPPRAGRLLVTVPTELVPSSPRFSSWAYNDFGPFGVS